MDIPFDEIARGIAPYYGFHSGAVSAAYPDPQMMNLNESANGTGNAAPRRGLLGRWSQDAQGIAPFAQPREPAAYQDPQIMNLNKSADGTERDRQEAFSAIKSNLPLAGLAFGLSLMANSERNSLGGALGKAGLSTLGALSEAETERRKEEAAAQQLKLQNRKQDSAEARQDFANSLALGRLAMEARRNDILERNNLFNAFRQFWKEQRDTGDINPFLRGMRSIYSRYPQTGLPVVPIPGIPAHLMRRPPEATETSGPEPKKEKK